MRAQTPPAPDRWELRRRYAAQDAALTDEQRELKALRAEVTHMRALLQTRRA